MILRCPFGNNSSSSWYIPHVAAFDYSTDVDADSHRIISAAAYAAIVTAANVAGDAYRQSWCIPAVAAVG